MSRFFGILAIYFKASMKSKFEYRGAFIWDAIGFILGYGTKFTLMWILITKFKYLNGWSPFEVMFLFSLSISSYTLASIFLGASTSQLPKKILNGSFDQSLTKPVHPFVFEVASAFSSYYFTHFIVSFSFLLICIINLGIQFNVVKVLFLIIFIFGSALIQGGMMILLNSVSFWILGNNPLAYEIFMSCRQLIEYPLSLYPQVLQILLTIAIPFGFISFYPAQYFLGKNDFLMFSPVLQYLNPFVGIAFFMLALWVWNRGIRRYQSTGT